MVAVRLALGAVLLMHCSTHASSSDPSGEPRAPSRDVDSGTADRTAENWEALFDDAPGAPKALDSLDGLWSEPPPPYPTGYDTRLGTVRVRVRAHEGVLRVALKLGQQPAIGFREPYRSLDKSIQVAETRFAERGPRPPLNHDGEAYVKIELQSGDYSLPRAGEWSVTLRFTFAFFTADGASDGVWTYQKLQKIGEIGPEPK